MTTTHQHQWVAAPDQPAYPIRYACTDCDTTTPGCNTCDQPVGSDLAICTTCLAWARTLLDDITETATQIPDAFADLMGLHAITYDRPRLSNVIDQLPHGLDAAYDDPTAGPAGVRTADGVHEVLAQWARRWIDQGASPDGSGATTAWLADHALWAAQNSPDWLDYLRVLPRLRAKARHLAGLNPVTEPVPCPYCGGRIIREWTDHGLYDQPTCTGCHRTWPTEAHYRLAIRHAHQQLPDTHPDAPVTIEDAKLIWKGAVRPKLFDLWVCRGILTPAGTDVRGATLYRLGDLAQRVAHLEPDAA